jgi:hypothetical protein
MNNSCLSADKKKISPQDNSELDGSYAFKVYAISNNFSLRLSIAYRTFSGISPVALKVLSTTTTTTTIK